MMCPEDRGSVLECASPLALCLAAGRASKSGGGPPHSKTLPRQKVAHLTNKPQPR